LGPSLTGTTSSTPPYWEGKVQHMELWGPISNIRKDTKGWMGKCLWRLEARRWNADDIWLETRKKCKKSKQQDWRCGLSGRPLP
jgi:hypothetical protein